MASHLSLVPVLSDGELNPPASLPIRVVLSDDHPTMRRSLRGLLDDEDDLEVVGEAESLEAVEREMGLRQPHVLVLDLGMHDGSSGFEAIGRLHERGASTMIVGLTMRDDPVFARHALTAGAVGFVSKHLADAELVQAIRAAARGEQFVSPRVAARPRARRDSRAQTVRHPAASEGSESSA